MPVGAKEKIVVVCADDKRLLLGVTPHNVSLLCELDEVADLAHDRSHQVDEAASFAQQIKKLLKQGSLNEGSTASERNE